MSLESILLAESNVNFEVLEFYLKDECSFSCDTGVIEQLYFSDRNERHVLTFLKFDSTIDAYEDEEKEIVTKIVGESPSVFVVTIYDFSFFKKLVSRVWENYKVVVDTDNGYFYTDREEFQKNNTIDEYYR